MIVVVVAHVITNVPIMYVDSSEAEQNSTSTTPAVNRFEHNARERQRDATRSCEHISVSAMSIESTNDEGYAMAVRAKNVEGGSREFR